MLSIDDYANVYTAAVANGYRNLAKRISQNDLPTSDSPLIYADLAEKINNTNLDLPYDKWRESNEIANIHSITYDILGFADDDLVEDFSTELEVGYWAYYYDKNPEDMLKAFEDANPWGCNDEVREILSQLTKEVEEDYEV